MSYSIIEPLFNWYSADPELASKIRDFHAFACVNRVAAEYHRKARGTAENFVYVCGLKHGNHETGTGSNAYPPMCYYKTYKYGKIIYDFEIRNYPDRCIRYTNINGFGVMSTLFRFAEIDKIDIKIRNTPSLFGYKHNLFAENMFCASFDADGAITDISEKTITKDEISEIYKKLKKLVEMWDER